MSLRKFSRRRQMHFLSMVQRVACTGFLSWYIYVTWYCSANAHTIINGPVACCSFRSRHRAVVPGDRERDDHHDSMQNNHEGTARATSVTHSKTGPRTPYPTLPPPSYSRPSKTLGRPAAVHSTDTPFAAKNRAVFAPETERAKPRIAAEEGGLGDLENCPVVPIKLRQCCPTSGG